MLKLATCATYWILVLIWSYILFFYAQRLKTWRESSKLIYILFIVLTIDAFRTLFESIYFGAWYTSLSGFLPKVVGEVLTKPEFVFIPKILNVIAGLIVVRIILFQWIPEENIERDRIAKNLNILEAQVCARTEELKELFDGAALGILLVDPQGTILDANREACTKLGYTPEDFKTLSVVDIVYPTDFTSQNVDPGIFLVLPGSSVRLELRCLCKNRSEFWVELISQKLSIGPNYLVMFLDITERKRAESELCRYRDHLEELVSERTLGLEREIAERKRVEMKLNDQLAFVKTLADTIPSPVFFKDIDGYYMWGNKAFKALRGEEELAGKTMFDFLKPEAGAFHRKMENEMYGGGKAISYEYETFSKTGERKEVIFHTAPFIDSEGRVKGLVCVMSDITDRKHAEESLRQSEEILRKILLGIKAGIIIVDPGTFTVVDVNTIAEEILGAPRETLVGRPCKSIKWVREKDGMTDETCPLVMGDMVNEEYRIERPNGSFVPVIKTVISANRSGQPMYYEILFDMTAKKALERQLILAQRLESIGGLAGGIAHEINTPIQYVGDNLSFLESAFASLTAAVQGCVLHGERDGDGLDLDFILEEVPKALTQSRDGVARVAEIVRAMKRFSYQGGEEKSLLDVPKAIENTVLVARNEWKYHAEVRLDLDPSVEFLTCFPGDFNQALLNILVNASHAITEKYSALDEKGIITITTRREGESFALSVSDTGCGIPENNLHRVFDQFFTTKEIGKGTGQGLALVHDVMLKHGGSVDVASTLGQGSTFTLRFPLLREAEAPV